MPTELPARSISVLIVGAGPSGLVLALWLTRLGIPVRMVDSRPGPATESRAVAVHARTLELYQQLQLTQAVLRGGHRAEAVNLWSEASAAARLVFKDLGHGVTPYPFIHFYPQDAHERLLESRLAQLGVRVERGTKVTDAACGPDGISVELVDATGGLEKARYRFVAGCDGAHSLIREAAGFGFPGGTYPERFYVADVDAEGAVTNGEVHVAIDSDDFLAVFPMSPERVRLVGAIESTSSESDAEIDADEISVDGLQSRVRQHMQVRVKHVHWLSTYRVHHRVAESFRAGGFLLVGDAAHIHSPVGGQGMNTGIGDAINLAWKLAAVLEGRAKDDLLDSYTIERRAFAKRLVNTTDRAFTFVTDDRPGLRKLRKRLVPLALDLLSRTPALGQRAFKVVSQTGLHYRHSPLSVGRAGAVRGGDRMPWVPLGAGDTLAALSEPVWQVHVFGEAQRGMERWCRHNSVRLHQTPWVEEHGAAGIPDGAHMLVRPDMHVAFAGVPGVSSLEDYFRDCQLQPCTTPGGLHG